MKKLLFLIIFLASATAYSQLYQGPATGSVPSGVTVSTDNFTDFYGDQISPYVRMPRNEMDEDMEPYPDYMNNVRPTGPEGSNVVKDKSVKEGSDSNPLLLKSFQGFNDPGNYIPPDQYIAVGPTHVVATDNGRFRIWDKAGNLIKSINISSWYATTLNAASPFDPKVEYDHFNKRWIMVWLEQNTTEPRGYYLISVSDDSVPTGTWYNWAIKSTLNGTTESGQWSDYQGVGFDSQCLYITGRQFGFSGGFNGCKFRIIGKAQLYANTAGALTWTDFWDIRDPNSLSVRPDGIRPTIIYGTPSEYYFMAHGPFTSNSYVILYKLVNPLSSPTITGVDVPVTSYSNPPSAQQLGGGATLESGGLNVRNEPTYRNGFLWLTHSVSSGTGYSNVNYTKVNASTNTAVEDVAFGGDPYYHIYPSIGVDKDYNILLTYSRSSTSEYVGAYYTYRLNTDPPNTLAGSKVLQAGKAYYFKDFGSGRNRWGDYTGVWVDPADQNNFWMISQYAETPANTWASWIGNVRLVPFSGASAYIINDTLKFGNKEINVNNTDTLSFMLYNYGSATLTVSAITSSSASFVPVGLPSFPLNLVSMDSTKVKVLCKPVITGNLNDTLRIASNDAVNPVKRVQLKGKGYVIAPAVFGTLYGVAGSSESGALVTINTSNGAGTTVGPTGFTALTGLSIRKINGNIYGSYATSSNTLVTRVNSAQGDAYQTYVVPLPNARAITWDINDDLYIAHTDGRLFKVNLANSDTDLVGATGITNLYGLAINPNSGSLYGISLNAGLYKISKQTGAATTINANMGISLTTCLTIDLSGKMYVIKGLGTQISDLYSVDTATGTPTLIGTTGKKGINGLAIAPGPIGIEPISTIIPDKFDLYQNYPNPFNPTTKVKFDVPKQAFVTMKIYDVTGRLVGTLVNQVMTAGRYVVDWNAAAYPSGVYFYHIEAGDYSMSKKMILIK